MLFIIAIIACSCNQAQEYVAEICKWLGDSR